VLSFSVPASAGAVVDATVGVHPYLDFFLLGLGLRCMRYRTSQVMCRKRTCKHSQQNNDCQLCTPHIPHLPFKLLHHLLIRKQSPPAIDALLNAESSKSSSFSLPSGTDYCGTPDILVKASCWYHVATGWLSRVADSNLVRSQTPLGCDY
jgi:hypothetical protein